MGENIKVLELRRQFNLQEWNAYIAKKDHLYCMNLIYDHIQILLCFVFVCLVRFGFLRQGFAV